jgi:hypothetical protein
MGNISVRTDISFLVFFVCFLHFWCEFLAFFVSCMHFFCIFGAFKNEDFFVYFWQIFCAFFEIVVCIFSFWCSLRSTYIRYREIISGITNMVKAMILAINNTPQKTYRIAQYTDSRNRVHPLQVEPRASCSQSLLDAQVPRKDLSPKSNA